MLFPDVVDHVWLFGSHARGRPDEHSDVDILVIGAVDSSQAVRRILEQNEPGASDRYDVCFYTWNGIQKIIKDGSLFGWHLKLEGKSIFDRSHELTKQLEAIQPYDNHVDDLMTLIGCTEDCIVSLKSNNSTVEFDAGVLATAARNTGIILSTYLDEIDFSQNAPFAVGRQFPRLKFPLSHAAYNVLLAFRYASERGENSESLLIDGELLLQQASQILQWQSEGLEFLRLEQKHAPIHSAH